jgi:type VI secretion system protein ImpL
LVVWLVVNLVLDLRAMRRDAQLIAKVAGPSPLAAQSAGEKAAAEEMGKLRSKLEDALTQLRKAPASAGKKRQYLYELPWYILIGPPGSGKTTALINSGLKFPLSDKFGRDPLRGVGGTRNCDWWFSDDAILLDTAGRYVLQDSNEAVDKKVWRGFLGLLKQFRPRQPINGALVAIGLPDLMQMTPEERSQHARAIKSRLVELQGEFGLRFPVYVLLTKMDRIAGFVEFFDDLDREERAAVWGMTFPLDDAPGSAPAIAGLSGEFDLLMERLNSRVLQRVNDERDFERRGRIFGFPLQVATLKTMLKDFMEEIFTPSRFEDRALLRGIYFTSATQEGTPIDRLMTAIASTFGLADQKPQAFRGPGKSYFVTRLLRDLIFEEASLAGFDPRLERRNRLLRQTALAGVGALAVMLIGAWVVSYRANVELIARERRAATEYSASVAPFVQPEVADDNVASVMPVLDRMRALPAGYNTAKSNVPLMRAFGLDQGRKLESQAVRAYHRALNALLLPRLIIGVETQLRNTISNPDDVSLFLPLYLMLAGQGPVDGPLVKTAVLALWGGRAYPGLAGDQARVQLEAHVDAMFEEPLPLIELDGALLARAREVVGRTPVSARAYNAIKNSAGAKALRDWRVVDNGGAAVDQVLVRLSGKPLAEGIPGFFTYQSFRDVLLPQIPGAISATAEATWMLGTGRTVTLTDDAARQLMNEVVDLYVRDFTSTWDQLLADVTIASFASPSDVVRVMNTLSGPVSPLRTYARAVAQETTMNRAAAAVPANVQGAVDRVSPAVTQAANALSKLVPSAPENLETRGHAIDAHYRALHDFVGTAPNVPSQLDDLLRRLGAITTQLSQGPTTPVPPGLMQLAQDSSRLPQPFGLMMARVAQDASTTSGQVTRGTIQELYASGVLRFCSQALPGRYPFAQSSNIDMAVGDFQSLFRPGGTLDAFFSGSLKPYVDTTASPWKSQAVNTVDLGLSRAGLVQFERAQTIRDSFFPGGGPMSVEFTLTPVALGNGVREAVFETDGQSVTYTGGAATSQRMRWPGPNPGAARLSLTRADGQTSAIEPTGPWALFRLLDRARIDGNLPDLLNVSFEIDGAVARFQLRASSIRNPFRTRDLRQFQCPSQL